MAKKKIDKKLMKSIKDAHKSKGKKKSAHEKKHKKGMKKAVRAKGGKMERVMKEYKEGKLHSGSKKGPEVKSRKQAIAIGLSEARKAGEKVKPKAKKKK